MERGSTGLAGAGQVSCEPKALKTLRVKMVLVGSSGVGKSSLALRFSKDEFRSVISPTVGCAYVKRAVYLSGEIWDTAGEEKYHSITHRCTTEGRTPRWSSTTSASGAQMWLRELEKQYIPGSTLLILVGNKEDLSQRRNVTTQEGLSLAEDRGLLFMETSSLSEHQVNELLLAICK
ncbi:unnamed protein product [Lota lota]